MRRSKVGGNAKVPLHPSEAGAVPRGGLQAGPALNRWARTLLGLILELALPGLGHASSIDDAVGTIACSAAVLRKHNPGLIEEPTVPVCFEAYMSNFSPWTDSLLAGDSKPFGIPHWTSQLVKSVRPNAAAMEGRERPRSWFTVPSLNEQGLAPKDENYQFSRAFRGNHADWYERGHLTPKYLAERLGPEAGKFTHNVVNAVPQRGQFNKNPWLTLECFTGAWANQYKQVWIVTGPVFLSESPQRWLRSDVARTKFPVAIPEALFKVVVRLDEAGSRDALAFLYPQTDPSYAAGPWSPSDYLTSITRIESLTGYHFADDVKPADRPRNRKGRLWQTSKTSFDPGCKKFAVEVP